MRESDMRFAGGMALLLAVAGLCAWLSGCAAPAAGTPGPSQTSTPASLESITLADLAAAAADAKAHNDQVALVCWTGLEQIVPAMQQDLAAAAPLVPSKPQGLAGIIQAARDVKAAAPAAVTALQALVQKYRVPINLSCGPLVVDTNAGVADPLGIFTGP